MKCQQLIMGSVLILLTAVGCGKKDEAAAPAPKAKPSTTNPQTVSNARPIQLNKINILSTQVFEVGKNITEVRGIYKGQLTYIVPCDLTSPIDLKRSLGGSTPIVNLSDVVTVGGGITKGKISTFEIKRNNSAVSIIGLRLLDNAGKVVAAQNENYDDTKANPAKCTQMLTESYNMHNEDGTPTRRVLNIVSVYEGDVITKTTSIVDDTRIMALQIEKKTPTTTTQYCVKDARLAIPASNSVAQR